jgi:ribosome recycling factor
MKLNNKEYEEKMKKSISVYEHELATIRAGRANPAVLDKITVDYFGSPTMINQMAEVRVADARTIVIQPWDASTLKLIDRAIQASDLGIQPQNDGKLLRIAFPQPTEERRKELTKQVEKMGEQVKIAIRNIRRDANDKCKDMKKKSEMTEDEQKLSEKSIQELTDKYIKEIDVVTANKEKEIMAI